MVGGRNYADSQFNRAVAAERQPGSSFKPFVYLAALEKGLTPDTVREDAPISIKGWNPENYSREYFGAVTLTKALSLSLNTVAVRLGIEVGPKAVVAVAHRLGVTSNLDPVPSIALGSSEVTPLEMVSAYAAFANGGVGVQPHVIAKVRTVGGKQLYIRRNASFGRVIEPQYVATMNPDARGHATDRHRPQGRVAGLAGRRQDRHEPGLARRLVHRLHQPLWSQACGSATTTARRPRRCGRQSAGRHLEPVHEGGARRRSPRPACPSGRRRNPDASAPAAARPQRRAGSDSQSGGRGGLNPQTGAVAQSVPPPPAPIPIPRGPPAPFPAAITAPIPPAPIPNSRAGHDKGPLGKLLGTL